MRVRLVAFYGASRRKGGDPTADRIHFSQRESQHEGDECRLFILEGVMVALAGGVAGNTERGRPARKSFRKT